MTQTPRHGDHRLPVRFLMMGVVIAVCMIMGGCASSERHQHVTIHEGPGEAVVLEPLTTATPARHPVAIEAPVVDWILRAVHVQQEERLLQRLMTGQPPPVRVFSDDQVGVLTPLLVTGFSRATTNQQIRFRLATRDSPVHDTTQGILYFSGSSLYFTLVQYGYGGRQASQDRPGRQLPDPTGLQARRVVFVPSGIRAGEDDRLRLAEERPPATLVINYERVKQWIASRTTPSTTPDGVVKADNEGERSAPRRVPIPAERDDGTPASEANVSPQQKAPDSRSLQELIVRKDLEIEALRDELQKLRQAYDLQQQELKRLKQRKRLETPPRN